MNTPFASISRVSPVRASRTLTDVTVFPSPLMLVTTVFVITSIAGFSNVRSTMIFDARNASRRCSNVTEEPKRLRKPASSIAESPPPTTTIGLPRKKNPSHVAQYETPLPAYSSSPGTSRCR